MKATATDTVVDTSGAGDWLSAGFLSAFINDYPSSTWEISREKVHQALVQGQEMSLRCCEYMGALGAFYESGDTEIQIDKTACDYCLT